MLQNLSIRKKQQKKVVDMLSLNPNDSLPDWKFIIYDSVGRDILDSLFTNRELRSHYVTLRLSINSERDQIPDSVSTVYFVMPTEENLKIICQDLTSHLYDSYYFNFISKLSSEDQFKQLAEATKSSGTICDIMKIKSQYLDFISMEDDFFVLRESDRDQVSFYAINRSDSSDDEITLVIDRIVDGLFSVLVTLELVPIIRSSTGGPAEFIADKLNTKIKETLLSEKNCPSDQKKLFDRKPKSKANSNSPRPLLCLIDRTVDMSTPLHHTWTYQAMIHDLLDIKLNKISINEETKTQLFDLNQEDKFWDEQKGSPFPQVADAVQRELDIFKKHKDDVNNKTIANIERILKKHTTIATGLLDEIKARKLDNFFEMEEKIMNRGQIDKILFDEMISSSDYGSIDDKYRLFLIAYICDNPCLTEEEADRFVDILIELGCNRTAFDYIRQWKSYSKANVVNLQATLQTGGGGVLKTASMFTKLVSQGSQFVMSGVKNLVIKEHNLPLTKIVDNLMDTTSSKSGNKWDREYRYFDPEADCDEKVQRRRYFENAIVFVVGGGNYIEYQNLIDYCKSSSRNNYGSKNIIYGASEIMNAGQFLSQLHELGNIVAE